MAYHDTLSQKSMHFVNAYYLNLQYVFAKTIAHGYLCFIANKNKNKKQNPQLTLFLEKQNGHINR